MTGVSLTSSEAKGLAGIIGPLLKRGLSLYQILQLHPELGICEKTIYNYIESGIFQEVAGISQMDLRRQGRKGPWRTIMSCCATSFPNRLTSLHLA